MPAIPRRITQIWIGPLPAPEAWMRSWRDLNPGLPWRLFDNAALTARRWRNQPLIAEYFRRGEYAGVSDLIRYELLLEEGGFLPEADSICLRPVDALFEDDRPFTCPEIPPELCASLGMPRKKGLLCPILGAPPGDPMLDLLIREIGMTPPEALEKPWKGSGNHRLRRFFAEHPDQAARLRLYPAHLFVPEHFRGWRYDGPDQPFCRQMWGTTGAAYPGQAEMDPATRAARHAEVLAAL